MNQTFTAQGALLAERTWQWDPQAGTEVEMDGPTLYSGPLRFQHLKQPRETRAGTQEITTQEYMVAVPEGVDDVASIAWVRVVESSDGSARLLKVTGIVRGSLRWQRDLYCIDNVG